MKALDYMKNMEIEHLTAIASKTQITVANFTYVILLSDYDFTFQSAINKKQLCDLETLISVNHYQTTIKQVGRSFSDITLANAILNKLLHHFHVIK